MPKNEDGEFELVVGNKQLLSIVFILMVLFGVVFSMGYFLGRANSGSEAPASAVAATGSGQARPEAVGAQAAPTAPPAARALEPGEATVATPETAAASEPPVTQTVSAPAAPEPQLAKPPVAPVKQSEPPQAESAENPVAGQTFLQVAAVKRPQAEVLVELLKKKGFRAIMSPVTVDGQEIFRTLVGPVKDASDLAKTKAGLESAGLKAIVKKY